MAYRWKPAGAEVDTDNPRAWGTCDRCGRIYNLHKLQFQYEYQGTTSLQNTGFLVCTPCYDVPNPQDMPYILPPDPPPIYNARPENYALDESSDLGTEDGDIITTEDGEPITTAIPNPSFTANTSKLTSFVLAPSGSVATAYLDLFDGDPTSGGRSVLETITGSATRTNIAADLTTVNGIAVNPDYIVISAASENQTNISYIGIYSAASSGTLLMSGPVSCSPTIAQDNPVQFNPLNLRINLN